MQVQDSFAKISWCVHTTASVRCRFHRLVGKKVQFIRNSLNTYDEVSSIFCSCSHFKIIFFIVLVEKFFTLFHSAIASDDVSM